MHGSNAMQHRIVNAFPNMTKWKNCDLVILNLMAFFEGEKIRINEGWRQSCGYSSLLANAEGRLTLKILKTVNISVVFGNDAPRGGAIGAYFKCARKSASASKFFRGLLDEIKAK